MHHAKTQRAQRGKGFLNWLCEVGLRDVAGFPRPLPARAVDGVALAGFAPGGPSGEGGLSRPRANGLFGLSPFTLFASLREAILRFMKVPASRLRSRRRGVGG